MGLLSLLKERTSSYYGKRAYKYVEKLLSGERNLLIISPYIDDYYADYLARHSYGKKMHIISSSIKGSAAKKLRGRGLGNALTATFLSVSVNWILFLLGAFNYYLAFLSMSAGIVLVAYAMTRRNSIYLKIPQEFVHAKMYVGDKSAIEGSANLTFAGMHQNIESVRLTSETHEVERLKRQFWTMWNSL
jgi:phosphatidylserine/phosphatidylglycerophosphate/cardiolipin synthase-like enzyme